MFTGKYLLSDMGLILELMANSRIGTDYLKKLELINLELEVSYKKV